MPTYEYSCPECNTHHEIVQSMADPTLTTCPNCGKESLRKQFSGVGVMFKGSGFYRTDSRSNSGSSGSGSSDSSSSAPASTTSTSSPSKESSSKESSSKSSSTKDSSSKSSSSSGSGSSGSKSSS